MPVNNIDLSNLSPLHGFIILGRAANDYAGLSVSSAGDVNGDGIDDLIVGAHYGDDGGENAGEAYLVYGKTGASRGPVDLAGLTVNDGFIILGDAAYDIAGSSVSSAGDVNGDGIDDLIVGARYGDDGGTGAGEAYVIFGQVGEARGQIDLTELAAVDGFVIQGDEANDFAGTSVSSAGDINGDGIDDLIVGAFGGDDGGTHSGVAHVIYGKLGAARGTVDLTGLAASVGFNIQGDKPNDFAGRSVSSAGDVNGDGIDDLIVAASYGDNGGVDAGEVYVVYGQPGNTRGTVDLTGLAASGGFCIQGFVAGSFTGWSVSSAGDVNGDGIDDLIIGAPYSDIGGANAGEAYVIFGQAGATRGLIDLSGLASSDGFVIRGSAANNFVGYSVSSAGDVNGDGIDDLIVGAFGCNDGGSYAGKAYVIYGQAGDSRLALDLTGLTASEGFAIQGAAVNDIAGTSVSSAGDVNGDGIDDLIIGAPYSDIGGTNSGAAYVIFGSRPSTAVDRTGTIIGQTIFGGNLDDTISGMGGNDCIDGGDGSDRLDGGSGVDSLDYSRSASAVEASLLNGTGTQGEAAGDTLVGFERIFGSAYADTLTGAVVVAAQKRRVVARKETQWMAVQALILLITVHRLLRSMLTSQPVLGWEEMQTATYSRTLSGSLVRRTTTLLPAMPKEMFFLAAAAQMYWTAVKVEIGWAGALVTTQ